ncbi:hypothetical protein IFM89_024606 [Coptis chinensis]|uniref:Uncharacterized protein n=1 Tax=Coptis chinensis TaxID=261450 RepID=A0A835LX36_9MAGN|nr:hypothetical protein IFM89_024606 [Coptis chinensis]
MKGRLSFANACIEVDIEYIFHTFVKVHLDRGRWGLNALALQVLARIVEHLGTQFEAKCPTKKDGCPKKANRFLKYHSWWSWRASYIRDEVRRPFRFLRKSNRRSFPRRFVAHQRPEIEIVPCSLQQ